MLMCVVDHPVAQPWWQRIHYNVLSGRELVYVYTVLLEKLHVVCCEVLNDCMQNVPALLPLTPYLQADMHH